MSTGKKPKCCVCSGNLSQWEISDNVYAGVDEVEYICYGCQAALMEESDDDEEEEEDFINE